MEVTHIREENKKVTKQMSDLRGKLADIEARVSCVLFKKDVLHQIENGLKLRFLYLYRDIVSTSICSKLLEKVFLSVKCSTSSDIPPW